MEHPWTTKCTIERVEELAKELGFFVWSSQGSSINKLEVRYISDPNKNSVAHAIDWTDCLAWLNGYRAGMEASDKK